MGVLSEVKKSNALAAIQQKYRGCPLCAPFGTRSSLGDVVALPLVEKGIPSGLTLGNQFMPVIPVVCENCGHTTFFSATKYAALNE